MAEQAIGLVAILDTSNFTKGLGVYTSGLTRMQKNTISTTGVLNTNFTTVGSTMSSMASIASGVVVAGFAAAATAGIGLVAGLGAIGASGLKAAISMEQSIADIRAVLGSAAPPAKDLQEVIFALGINPNLKVSATEAAQSIELLARNGIKWSDIAGGAAENSILLANATGADFASAADVATDVMVQFGIEASNMSTAVDGITSVVNNSKFDFDDYRLAIGQAGGVAGQLGVEFKDFNTAIAATASSFTSGSDAGTSFKTFLTTLVPKSKDAAQTMRSLGLFTGLTDGEFEKLQGKIEKTKLKIDALDPSSKNYQTNLNALQNELGSLQKSLVAGNSAFFDQQGNMEDMGTISVELNKALGGLTEEQRNSAAATIFGRDAMRTAFGLMEAGKESVDGLGTNFEVLQRQMDLTKASESMKTRMDTVAGVLEVLSGVLETVQLQIGFALLPAFRKFAELLRDFVVDNNNVLIPFFENLGLFLEENLPIAAAIAGNVFTNVLIPAFNAFASFVETTVFPILESFAESFPKDMSGVGSNISFVLNNIILPAFTALTGFISDIVVPTIISLKDTWDNDLLPAFRRVQEFIDTTVKPSLLRLSTIFTAILGPSFDELSGVISGDLLPEFDDMETSLGSVITNIVDVLETNWPILEEILIDTMFFIRDDLIPQFISLKLWFDENMPGILATVATNWEKISSVISTVANFIIEEIIPKVQGILTKLQNTMDILGIDWDDVWTAIKGSVLIVSGIIGVTVLSLVDAFLDAFENISESIRDLASLFERQSDLMKEFFGNLSEFITNLIAGDFSAAWENAKTVFSAWVDSIGVSWEIIKTIFDGSLGTILGFVDTFIRDFLGLFTELSTDLVGNSIIPDMMRDIISSIVTGFTDIIFDTATFVTDMANELLSGEWFNIGTDIISGVTEGIKSKTSDMLNAVSGAATDAVNRFKSILDISSPSRVFVQLGEDTGEGFVLGMQQKTPSILQTSQQLGETAIAGVQTGTTSLLQPTQALSQPAANTITPQGLGGNTGNIESLLGSLLSVLGGQQTSNSVNQSNQFNVTNETDAMMVASIVNKQIVGAFG